MDILKDKEFWIFGIDMNGILLYKWNIKGKLVLVIGNEGKGIFYNIKK